MYMSHQFVDFIAEWKRSVWDWWYDSNKMVGFFFLHTPSHLGGRELIYKKNIFSCVTFLSPLAFYSLNFQMDLVNTELLYIYEEDLTDELRQVLLLHWNNIRAALRRFKHYFGHFTEQQVSKNHD